MLTQSKFFGGSEAVTIVAAEDCMHPDRAFAYYIAQAPLIAAGHYMYTPNVSDAAWRWRPREGRAMFMVVRRASALNAVTIKRYSDDATLVTLSPGQVAYLYLIDAATDEWQVVTRTLNTARTRSEPAGTPAPENEVGYTTYDPFCFDGSLCEYLRDAGNEPLDGTDSTDEVVAPMYQDPSIATNQYREAIRAADVVMPKLIALRLEDDCFEVDTNHPWYGTYMLSDEFWNALYGRSGAQDAGVLGGGAAVRLLEYASALSYPTTGVAETGNPYHLRLTGAIGSAVWKHKTDANGDVNALRYAWSLEVPYGPIAEPDRYTLEFRFQLEHLLDAPAVADSDGGGAGTNTHGAHGGVFSLSIFTNELNTAWVEDSTTFQPADFSNAYTWNRANPIICGIANGYSEATADKGVHPQCVAHATIVMTWHGPIGRNWVPLNERETVPGSDEAGKNLTDAYVVRNGNPWTSFGSCADDAPLRHVTPGETTGQLYNCVFGYASSGTTLGKALTYGGDLPVSSVFEWLCWENGTGAGRTFLKPLKPGWSEVCGKLTVEDGNCAEIAICTSDGDNSRDGSDGAWPRLEVSPCDGHPDEPFEAVGGSHRAFKNTTGTTQKGSMNPQSGTHCCVKPSPTSILFKEYCNRDITVYGDPLGNCNDCDIVSTSCETAGHWTTQFSVHVYDYTLQANGNPLTRELRWSHYASDPAHPPRDYVYDSASTGTLTAAIGSWTYGASEITNTAGAGTNDVRALMHHHDTSAGSWGWWGCALGGTFERTLSNGHGVGAGYEQSANNTLMIGMHVSPVDVDSVLVEVSVYDGATKTVLESTQLDGVSTDGVFSMAWHGTDVTFSYEPTTGPTFAYTASWWDADLDAGALRGCLFSEDTAGHNAGFSNVVWGDTVGDLEEAVFGYIRADSIFASCTGADHLAGYGRCADSYPVGCGTCDQCNCRAVSEVKSALLDAEWNPSPWRDIDDWRVAAGECSRTDKQCFADWVADNPTCATCPSPARCICDGRPSSGSWAGCDTCEGGSGYQGHKPYVIFPLPLDQACYATNVIVGTELNPDVECLNDIPLMCRGIAIYDWAVAL